jgi:glycosyltransferase involved in cell wall biosynthesis
VKVSVIVFEINEIDGMKAMMPQIKPEWYYELIVVDGGSTDGTIEYCKSNNIPVFIQEQPGVGGALDDAMKRVTGDVVVIYAPDGSFLADRIPMMVQKIKEGADIVNASRYIGGMKSEDDTVATGFANWLFSFAARIVFGWNLTDFLYTYLAFTKEAFDKCAMSGVTERTWGQIFLMRAFKRNLKIVEIPGPEMKRIGGAVKVPKVKAGLAIVRSMLQEFFSK